MLKPSAISSRVYLAIALIGGLTAVVILADVRPLNVHTGYAPEQPIAYSHRLHAGDLAIDCTYCHYGAKTSPRAGIPPTSLCMNCHTSVSAGFDAVLKERADAAAEKREARRIVSPEIAKLYRALGLDKDLKPLPEGPKALAWVKVHNLPDFVAFDHSVHVTRGLACETCHGPVQTMERVRQENNLTMGWCISCHRSRAAEPAKVFESVKGRLPEGHYVSTDCAVCHY